MKESKKNKKVNIPVAVWLLIFAGVLVVGALYLVDGKLLKTQVAPGEDTSTAKDWESIGAPGLGAGMVGTTRVCPSPTPSSSPLSSPAELSDAGVGKVAGWEGTPSVSTTPLSCPEGFVAEGFNEYEYSLDKSEDNILRTLINGMDPEYILTAVCDGNPQPPRCSSQGFLGCSWMKFVKEPRIALSGLYLKVSGLYKLVEGAYVYPDGLYRPETKQWVPGVYPSPPENDDELLFALGMSLWKLSPGDRQILEETHPKLLEVAQGQISGIAGHERVHWQIYERYLPNYVAMINGPQYDTDWSVSTVNALGSLIEDTFKSGWESVGVLERAEHDAFHRQEAEVDLRRAANIPYDGLDDIYCPYMEGLVGPLVLNAKDRKGYVKADYPTGGRLVSCDNSCWKDYFTGTDIRIEARPKAGYKFREWQNDEFDKPCTVCAGSKNPVCTLQISSAGSNCWAVFDPIGSPSPS
ncbi:MAG: hypothetical protein ABIH36_01305 [bacterium]